MTKATTITLPWLNHGEPIPLKPMPIAGQREVEQIKDDFVEEGTVQANAYVIYLRGAILQTKRLMDTKGVDEAKKVWDEGIGNQFSNLEWPSESFEDSLNSWYQEMILDGLSTKERPVKDYESAKAALEEDAGVIQAKWAKHRKTVFEYKTRLMSTELYWRLRKVEPAPRLTPPGTPEDEPGEPLNMGDRDAAIAAIEEWLDEDEWGRIYAAFRGHDPDAEPEKPRLDAKIKMQTTEEMRGKSGAASPPSTAPSADSALSSETSTETTTKS